MSKRKKKYLTMIIIGAIVGGVLYLIKRNWKMIKSKIRKL